MMKENQKLLASCPYWVDEDGHNECNISKGGLFIPMPQHIETFCLSERFDKCNHYIRAYELLRDHPIIIDGADRRSSPRIGCDCSLFFTSIEDMGRHGKTDPREAQTVNISVGGMQIYSSEVVPIQHRMAFKFGPDFAKEFIAGIGEVQWCRETDADSGFFAGIAFAFLHDEMKTELRNHISSRHVIGNN